MLKSEEASEQSRHLKTLRPALGHDIHGSREHSSSRCTLPDESSRLAGSSYVTGQPFLTTTRCNPSNQECHCEADF